MNDIKVPYLPISRFDALDISEKFSEKESEEVYLSNEKNFDSECFERDKVIENVELALRGMGMDKYVELFLKRDMCLDTFLQLDETDLEEIGITDLDDRKIIVQNLSLHRPEKDDILKENSIEDFIIFKNIYKQLVLIHCYCAYLDLQFRKKHLVDYKIDEEESACIYLKAFTEAALVQSQILSEKLYSQCNSDSLLDTILKANNLTLPQSQQEKLPKKILKSKRNVMKIVIIVGFSSLLLITGRHLIRRFHIL